MMKLMVSRKGVSNRALIVLALAFILINLFNIFLFSYTPTPIGRVVSPATLSFCIHYAPEILINDTNFTLTEGQSFMWDINHSDRDENSVEFLDNTTVFDIDPVTGIIDFTPNSGHIWSHSVNLSVRETNTSCGIILQDSAKVRFDIWGVSNLSIWDDTDPQGGSQYKYVSSNVHFFANYSSYYNKTVLNGTGIYCQIMFNLSNTSINYTAPLNMSFNSASRLYIYNRTFNESGNISFNVFCDATPIWYKTINTTDRINLAENRPPVLRFNLPNITWNEDTILQYYDLDDYFADPNNDPLTYSSTSVPGIDISINPVTHRPTFTPKPNYCGNATVYFYATDPGGLSASSNLVHLYVICMPEPVTGYSSPTAAGGGGGGVGAKLFCIEYWRCGDWEDCLPTNLKYRTCVDLHNCSTTLTKPNESMSCVYIGNCKDNIKNCHDLLCEDGVDCGGPCPPCPTCWDGIKNQGEEGIDCGGMCPPCEMRGPIIELPAIIGQIPDIIGKSLLLILLAVLIAVIIFSAISLQLHRYVQPRLASLIVKVMKAIIFVRRKEVFVSEEAGLRVSTLLKLGELETRIARGGIKVLSKEFSDIMKEFFTSLLHIDQTITYEELSKHIEGMSISTAIKIVMITFIKKLVDLGYGGFAIDRDALRQFVDEAKGVVVVTTEKPLVVKEGLADVNLVARVNNILSMAENIVKKDPGKAASLYRRLTVLYSAMSEAEKLEVYDRLHLLYQSIKKKVKT